MGWGSDLADWSSRLEYFIRKLARNSVVVEASQAGVSTVGSAALLGVTKSQLDNLASTHGTYLPWIRCPAPVWPVSLGCSKASSLGRRGTTLPAAFLAQYPRGGLGIFS